MHERSSFRVTSIDIPKGGEYCLCELEKNIHTSSLTKGCRIAQRDMTTALENRPSKMPMPSLDPVEAGLWQAAAKGRLEVQKCTSCGSHRNPPSNGCIRCGSLDWTWDALPGTGVILTYTWIPDPARGEKKFPSPYYNVAVVELDGTQGGPVRIVTNVLDAWQLEDLFVGQRVTLSCVKLTDEIGLPCFRRVNVGR